MHYASFELTLIMYVSIPNVVFLLKNSILLVWSRLQTCMVSSNCCFYPNNPVFHAHGRSFTAMKLSKHFLTIKKLISQNQTPLLLIPNYVNQHTNWPPFHQILVSLKPSTFNNGGNLYMYNNDDSSIISVTKSHA